MIDLYTWSTPNGRKVSILLEELGLDYTTHAIDIGAGDQHTPDFLEISPNGKIPAIVERATGRVMMESGAILLYLAEREGKLMGDDRWETIEWLMWQMGGVGPMLGQAHHFLYYNEGKAPYAEARYAAEAKRLYGVLDARLAGRDFVSGSYSIADIALWPWISRFGRQRVDLPSFANVCAWYRRIAERGAVQRGYAVPPSEDVLPMP